MNDGKKCPVTGKTNAHAASKGTSNQYWWPKQLNLHILHQHSSKSNPMGEEFNYAEEFSQQKKNRPMMTTADLSLRFDPIYEPIARRYLNNPEEFQDAFGRAWFKLTHRDMGPVSRYLGMEVPKEELIWQDPVPQVDHELIAEKDVANLKGNILAFLKN